MTRAQYPIAPEDVVKFLYERHAYWGPTDDRLRANPCRLSELMRGLGLKLEQRNKFAQQLQHMAYPTFRYHGDLGSHFGLHHGCYPTGWQLTTAGAMAWRKRTEPIPAPEAE